MEEGSARFLIFYEKTPGYRRFFILWHQVALCSACKIDIMCYTVRVKVCLLLTNQEFSEGGFAYG